MRSLLLLIEPETAHIHQDRSQQAIGQVPEVASSDMFEAPMACQLSKDGINKNRGAFFSQLYQISSLFGTKPADLFQLP